MEKAQNAIFLLNKAINYGGVVSTALNSILFFSKIAPILLYGAPIWGPSPTLTISYEPLTPVTVQNIEAFKAKISKVTSSLVQVKLLGQEKKVLKVYTTSLEDKAKIIKSKLDDNNFRRNSGIYELQSTFQSFLCKHAKRILGLSKYASNTLSCAELGWFPIQHKIILATLKYWLRLQKGTTNDLLDKAFKFNTLYGTEWTNGIKNIKLDLDLDNNLDDPKSTRKQLQETYKKLLKTKITTDQHRSCYSGLIHKNSYLQQQYLTKIENPLHRATLTKLRTNSFNYTSYDSDEIYCPKCTLREKYDLTHWLLRCTNNQLIQPRNNLLRLLKSALKANNYRNPLKDLLN